MENCEFQNSGEDGSKLLGIIFPSLGFTFWPSLCDLLIKAYNIFFYGRTAFESSKSVSCRRAIGATYAS